MRSAPVTPVPSPRPRRRVLDDLRHDLPASLVVFLVAVPLSLGIAVASGAPVMSGLIAGVVGGVVAGLLGGSALQVSGPAAGLTVVVAGLVDQFGWAVTCAITAAAGLLQILFGVSRIARSALAISPPVVRGMLAGIGITIALGQLHVLLGGTAQTDAWANLQDLPGQLLDIHRPAAVLGLLVIALLLLWPRMPAGLQAVPGPLVGVVGVTALSWALALDVERVELPESLVASLTLPELPDGAWGAVITGVFTVAGHRQRGEPALGRRGGQAAQRTGSAGPAVQPGPGTDRAGRGEFGVRVARRPADHRRDRPQRHQRAGRRAPGRRGCCTAPGSRCSRCSSSA